MLKFTVVMNDVSVDQKYHTEHGLSFWIEHNDSVYLFDTGQSESFYENIKLKGFDINDIDHIVLSHAHYDHTGGVSKIIDVNPVCAVHVGDGFWDTKYSKNDNDYIHRGNNFIRNQIEYTNLFINEIKETPEIVNNEVYILNDIKRASYYERIDPKFFVEKENQMVQDDFSDEIVLCFDDPRGMIIFAGCSHPGIVNILESVKQNLKKSIYAVFGGFHLNGQDAGYIEEVADYLKENVEIIGTGHCTGTYAVNRLKRTFKEKYVELNVGEEHVI